MIIKAFSQYRLSLALSMAILLSACSGDAPDAINASTAEQYIAIKASDCDQTGINGKWKFVGLGGRDKTTGASNQHSIAIRDCSVATYTFNHSGSHSDNFRMLRVIQYCADYQLVYSNDSIACINFRKDTMIIGACNDYEDTRYYYKRM